MSGPEAPRPDSGDSDSPESAPPVSLDAADTPRESDDVALDPSADNGWFPV